MKKPARDAVAGGGEMRALLGLPRMRDAGGSVKQNCSEGLALHRVFLSEQTAWLLPCRADHIQPDRIGVCPSRCSHFNPPRPQESSQAGVVFLWL